MRPSRSQRLELTSLAVNFQPLEFAVHTEMSEHQEKLLSLQISLEANPILRIAEFFIPLLQEPG